MFQIEVFENSVAEMQHVTIHFKLLLADFLLSTIFTARKKHGGSVRNSGQIGHIGG